MKMKDYSLFCFLIAVIVTVSINAVFSFKMSGLEFGLHYLLNCIIGFGTYIGVLGYKKSEDSNQYSGVEKQAVKSFDFQDIGSAIITAAVAGLAGFIGNIVLFFHF